MNKCILKEKELTLLSYLKDKGPMTAKMLGEVGIVHINSAYFLLKNLREKGFVSGTKVIEIEIDNHKSKFEDSRLWFKINDKGSKLIDILKD